MSAITKKYFINGPNNVIRLTNGKKVLYIFGDYHFDIDNQNECFYDDNHDSMDFDKFILSFIKLKTNIKYDLFAEMPQHLFLESSDNINAKWKYIWNYHRLIRNNVKKKFKNFRFHYFDIRQNLLFYYQTVSNPFNDNVTGMVHILYYTELKEFIISYLKLLNKNYFIKKILNKYENLKIKKKINDFYKNHILKNYQNVIKIIKKFIHFIKLNFLNIRKKFTYYYHLDKIDLTQFDIIEKTIIIYSHYIYNLCFNLGVIITDLFFIRRFLDKNYINHGIIYTGHLHLADISTLLIKFFKFKITHISYQPELNININKYIKSTSFNNLQYMNQISNLLTNKLSENVVYQCTNLFNFPKNFT